jgi:hypothetical protein
MNLPVLPKYQVTTAFRKTKILRAALKKSTHLSSAADSRSSYTETSGKHFGAVGLAYNR